MSGRLRRWPGCSVYVTRRQLLDLGISSTAIARRRDSGRLIPVSAGVYAVGHLPPSRRTRFEADRERDAAMLAPGIVTVRITWEPLIHFPEREAAGLLSVLEDRRFLLSSETQLAP